MDAFECNFSHLLVVHRSCVTLTLVIRLDLLSSTVLGVRFSTYTRAGRYTLDEMDAPHHGHAMEPWIHDMHSSNNYKAVYLS